MSDDQVEGGPIPDRMRQEIYVRDNLCCRMCGKNVEGDFGAGIHHIEFGGSGPGMGGKRLHIVAKMVLLCERDHRRAHAQKSRWIPYLLQAAQRPGVTAFQLERWSRRGAQRLS